uniref:Aminopeptidase Ey-like n=1 Tax=Sinocyclocheilus grahami TaxID=75366 RepID=A0A672KGY0_SINGR
MFSGSSFSVSFRLSDEVNVTADGTLVTRTTFAPTEVMSTYLLAFIVSDFGFIEQNTDKLQIRIFARQEAINAGQGEYALNVTGPILKFFEKYYNVPYPLPKSDQIALPDFNAGAMENWGLITYRETALLYDEEISSNGNKESIVTIIAHELAHQWFGNLVTLRWWNDLWLNEGFASYVEYLGADDAEPDWNVKDLIVLNDVHRVFAIDALASSHPLSFKEEEIQRPEQINEVFDTISYSKGASVLRMLSDFLTETVFTQGLQTYLDYFKFSNTVYTDLWHHLQLAVNGTGTSLPKSVQEIMDRWVLQMGFPVVTINTTTGQITQEHFLLDPESKPDRTSEFNYEWFVPISWTKKEVAQPLYWLLKKTAYYLKLIDYHLTVIFKCSHCFSIKANLRSTVYCSAIAAGGEEEWNFAWEMFENATIASEKDKLRAAMACATEPWLLNRYLKYTLDPEKIRKQDATSTIISIASNV